ncbi:hypothetical protein ACI5KX_04520 [Erythrobacter sp. GH1-10]|uniref:hypothetical protein n=1 Tax=Erythrobacter sp. GH1-10 TaxID=3349334 RepID=UPI003877A40E
MDLNQLLYNHQVAKMNANHSASNDDRKTYFDLVGYYEKRIAAFRKDSGLSSNAWLHRERLGDFLSG